MVRGKPRCYRLRWRFKMMTGIMTFVKDTFIMNSLWNKVLNIHGNCGTPRSTANLNLVTKFYWLYLGLPVTKALDRKGLLIQRDFLIPTNNLGISNFEFSAFLSSKSGNWLARIGSRLIECRWSEIRAFPLILGSLGQSKTLIK